MCWKTLDTLRSELRVTRVDVSSSPLAWFNEVHEDTLKRIEDEAKEPGFSLAGGRRLSEVFQDHPQYRNRADLVFGKDHLRNPDLFRAFANCLPDFVTKHPEESVGLMEGLVCYDHLWTSLQVHLQNSLRSNTFIPDKLRVFERCCIVIDTAFMTLEDSQIVDWRAPDLGPLSHYFELFVTDCFQGIFVERAIGFRVGLIKARFCKVVLAQYLNEFNREGTVVFRSQWDVASLARVFYFLGVGNDADVEFWKSFVDGGRIGAEFMAKTHAMLATATRDGPLLNFCKLGHLGMMAVPFKESGLEDMDFKKLFDLLQKMMEDPRLTLASTPVWEDLADYEMKSTTPARRAAMRMQNICGLLLAKINAVYNYRPSSTQERPQAIISPTQGDDSREITSAPFDISRGEFPNLYRNAYPILPSQIGPSGAIIRPFSASFLPTLSPHLESLDRASGIPFIHTPSLYMRHNDQHRRAPVYYPPKRRTVGRSAMLSSLQPPTSAHSPPSNTFTPPASSVVLHS
ncbi:hypothetical protein BJY52DRAFT_1269126 [Lactarius psammicola]|nr:hypothetical protein BJY52DRAFT_1269126 [Lactarius psammicola]